jgi:RNA polymerase sigma-70 factor, ECF subfamily
MPSNPLIPAEARDRRDSPVPRAQVDDLFSATYEELRRLAATVRGDDPSATLNPTALVAEAYLRLGRSLRTVPGSELHFKRIAARAMRQVLVDAARHRNARKRGGRDALVTLDEGVAGDAVCVDDVLEVDDALEELAALNARQARMIEFRYFGGYEVSETAALLGVSESTLMRDWRAARAWLARRLRDRT